MKIIVTDVLKNGAERLSDQKERVLIFFSKNEYSLQLILRSLDMLKNGAWLSILDYAKEKNTSISTIRRSIKSGRVRFKEEDGKYFIWVEEKKPSLENIQLEEIEKLKKVINKQKEEIEDLKMLLSVYEKNTSLSTTRFEDLPPLPEIEL